MSETSKQKEAGRKREEETEARHYRAPIADTLRRKSPFDSLVEHAGKVHECLQVLSSGFEAYLEGDFEGFHPVRDDVSRLEHEADLIKYNARSHLPRFLFMPVNRSDFLSAISQQDKILDYAEALADLMDMRPTPVPVELRPLMIEHKKKVVETLQHYAEAVASLSDAVGSGFSRPKREATKAIIKQVHQSEYEADQTGNAAKRKVYELEQQGDLSPMDEYHILKIIDWVDEMADRAENASERIRIMVAR
jgi:uncharacterized protein